MRIWIVYASVGSGHHICAAALKQYFPDAELYDCLDFCPRWAYALMNRGYMLMVRYAPWLWAACYYLSDWLDPLLQPLSVRLNKKLFSAFLRKARDDRPDAIIATHFFVAQVAGSLKKEIPLRLVSVITDFGVHRYWVDKHVDGYVCASSATEQHAIRKGIDPRKIIARGMPVRKGFVTPQDTAALAKKYGVNEGRFTILLSASNLGTRFVEAVLRGCPQDAEVFVITGKNLRLERTVASMTGRNFHYMEACKTIWEIFALTDCVVTKSGGMISFECFATQTFPIFVQGHPGQEYLNALILTREFGFGVRAYSVADTVRFLKMRSAVRTKSVQREIPDPVQTVESIRRFLEQP